VSFLPRDQCRNFGGGFLHHLVRYSSDENGTTIPPIKATQMITENNALDF
jgi:hypothetical protein